MTTAILLAAGRSRRFQSAGRGARDKLFESLNGKSVFLRALEFLEDAPAADAIIIAAGRKNKKRIEAVVRRRKFRKVRGVVLGGAARFESLKKALAHAPLPSSPGDFFVIHNAANPLATQADLQTCFQLLRGRVSGAAVGRPVFSTLKLVGPSSAHGSPVGGSLPRATLWETETPQVVRAQDFLQALEKLSGESGPYTDDLAVLEAVGKKTALTPASFQNRKLTTRDDLDLLRTLADSRRDFAVGVGEDSHAFETKPRSRKRLVLGGVAVRDMPPLKAQSDGDVILHALCNALSSALGGGSLGTFATSMSRRGIKDSRRYLRVMLEKMRRQNRTVEQCAFSLEAARPLIDPLAPKMKKSLAALLKISPQRIGITATSGEKLTPFGRAAAIRCRAAVILSGPTLSGS